MTMPKGIKAIDLMLSIPVEDTSGWYEFMKPMLTDKESRETFEMPAQYMFKDIPKAGKQEDYIKYTIEQMDKHSIERAMIGIDDGVELHLRALELYPDRFFASYECNPNRGMEEVRKIRRLHADYGIKAVTAFASGLMPQVPINGKEWYPVYVACMDLDIPICHCVGVPGPRLPLYPQKVEHLDEVCWFFPELRVVMRHGAEPWQDLAVKLMLKYHNLYYCTSAFAPKYYPREIIYYANTRGTDKVMYAGYFPMGLSLDRIFSELPDVPFRDHVWPKFLRENAIRVFKLDE
jgi:predicted TIM-barrel fold metal-dependent hydrolase